MRKLFICVFILTTIPVATAFGQLSSNCFLDYSLPKFAEIPISKDAVQPTSEATVYININTSDTLGKISNYIFGNALPSWLGNVTTDNVFLNNVSKLAPTLIRYPGGSWSDIFFWNGVPTDIPDVVWDGNSNKWTTLYAQSGKNSWPTTLDNYYTMRDNIGSQGLITINYGYARYGTGADPVAQAAHLAADWVRYDNGRTLFWEIGNENGGPWEAGWKIDTTLNKDHQPEIISGELYGKHFKIFTDSMRAAAAECGADIFIGGQIIHFDGSNSWNAVDKKWNEGFFKEGAPYADFYVMHNYFGTSSDPRYLLDWASSETQRNISFIRQDIKAKGAPDKPVAITEYNMSGTDLAKTSFVNGMQEIILFSEFIKQNFGMSCRWLLATGDGGMFYDGNDSSIPAWNPRPEFYYAYYIQKFFGDYCVNTVTTNNDILSYASKFDTGETGVVVVNKGTSEQTVKLLPTKGVGNKFYVYSLTGGTDNGQLSQYVYINGTAPTGKAWGPLEGLDKIPAKAYPITSELKYTCPPRSVQFIMIERGSNIVSVENNKRNSISANFTLEQNYPNPFNPETVIRYSLPANGITSLKICDLLGRQVIELVNEYQSAGAHSIPFNARKNLLPSGVYFYTLSSGNFIQTKKMVLMK